MDRRKFLSSLGLTTLIAPIAKFLPSPKATSISLPLFREPPKIPEHALQFQRYLEEEMDRQTGAAEFYRGLMSGDPAITKYIIKNS